MRKLVNMLPAVIGGIAGKAGAGKGLIGAGAGLIAARIARKSVPGALLVGGAMVAKYLYDKKQAEKAAEGTDAVASPAPAPATPAPPPPDTPASGH
jgi:hypothetical protein